MSHFQVFDITRKGTYKNLAKWYKELRDYRENIPCIVIANKIDGILLCIFVNNIVICIVLSVLVPSQRIHVHAQLLTVCKILLKMHFVLIAVDCKILSSALYIVHLYTKNAQFTLWTSIISESWTLQTSSTRPNCRFLCTVNTGCLGVRCKCTGLQRPVSRKSQKLFGPVKPF